MSLSEQRPRPYEGRGVKLPVRVRVAEEDAKENAEEVTVEVEADGYGGGA